MPWTDASASSLEANSSGIVLVMTLNSFPVVYCAVSRSLLTSLSLAPAGIQTVSVFIWRQFEQGSVGQGMAMATLALTVGLTLMLMQRGAKR